MGKKEMSQKHFGEVTNYGSTKTGLAPPEEPYEISNSKKLSISFLIVRNRFFDEKNALQHLL
jgi:hypothetical protein